MYIIEQGDFVTFRPNQPKDFTKHSPTKYNIPACLWGLHINKEPVDRHTAFMVLYVSDAGVILAVDEFESGLFFHKNRLQWSSSPIVPLSTIEFLRGEK